MVLEFIIHGTKGDYRTFYQTVGAPATLVRDMRRPEGCSRQAVGQVAYGICIIPGGCAYTKYLIVNDVDPQNVGYIAFSIYVPDNRKLAGSIVQELLDKMCDYYVSNYVENGTIGQRQPDGSVHYKPEEWGAYTHLVRTYEAQATICPSDEVEARPTGTGEPAFIYYENEEELQRYFDSPYQSEYADYRVVYLLQAGYYSHPASPLGVLAHNPAANLTGRVDLNNQRYRVSNFSAFGKNGVSITFTANGQPLRTGSRFFAKDTLGIRYTKNQFYRPIEVSGKITDSAVAQYLIIDGDKVAVNEDIELHPARLRMAIMLQNGGPGVKLVCLDNAAIPQITFDRPEVEFEGEELGYRWCLSSPDGKQRTASFRPCDYLGQTIPAVSLALHTSKVIAFNVHNENNANIVQQCKLQIENGGRVIQIKNGHYEFVGPDIDLRYVLRVTCSGYKPYSASFSPAQAGNTANITLVKAEELPEPADNDNPFGEDYVTPAKPVWPKMLAIILVAILLVGGLVWAGIYFFGNHDDDVVLISPEKVASYLDGSELTSVKLNAYMDSCVIAVSELSNDAESQGLLEEYKALQARLTAAISWRAALDSANLEYAKESYFPQDSSLFHYIADLSKEVRATAVEAMLDPAAGVPDMSIPDLDTLLSNVALFCQLRKDFAAGVSAANNPQPAPEEGEAAEQKASGQEFYVNALRSLNSLNLPELAMVQDFRQNITSHLTGSVVIDESADEQPAQQPAAEKTAQQPVQQPAAKTASKPAAEPKKPSTPDEQFRAEFWKTVGDPSKTPDDLDALYTKYRSTKEVKATDEWVYLADATASAGRKKFKALAPKVRQDAAKSKNLSKIPVK